MSGPCASGPRLSLLMETRNLYRRGIGPGRRRPVIIGRPPLARWPATTPVDGSGQPGASAMIPDADVPGPCWYIRPRQAREGGNREAPVLRTLPAGRAGGRQGGGRVAGGGGG